MIILSSKDQEKDKVREQRQARGYVTKPIGWKKRVLIIKRVMANERN